METLNHTLFLWINAPAQADPFTVAIAMLCAGQIIWVVPALLAINWLRGDDYRRRVLLTATVATLLALGVNQLIGLVWPQPRPFMIGLGHTYLAHAADPSFPSDHMTVLATIAGSFLLYRGFRLAGLALALLALPVAWARIYLGVHFPLDMIGAVAVAATSAWFAALTADRYLPPLYGCTIRVHRMLFGRLIAAGWLRH